MQPVEITSREIYDALQGVRGDVQALTTKVDAMPDRISDHETRIRVLEKAMWRWAGVAAMAGAGLAQVVDSLGGR